MKKFKKISALLLAAMMVLAMSVTAMGATVTLSTLDGHTYEIFQVFTGTVDADGKTLTELKYGFSSKGTVGDFLSSTDLAKLKALQSLTDEHAIITEYSKFVDFTKPYKTVDAGKASENLDPGFYVIRDVGDIVPSDKENDTTTLYMFKVLNQDLTTSAKAGTVEAKKKVKDINDSTDTDYGQLQDSADHEIGDTIPYTLTFKLPANYDKFEKYYVQFSDDMCPGLTLIEDSVKIQYGATGTPQTIEFTNSGAGTLGTLYTYEIKDLKTTASTLAAGDVITITYNAYLNDKAVIGSTGNPNEYTVKFNNNPNKSGEGQPTGNTPKDKNIVFTYKTVFDKVDENKEPLKGADFKLEKQMADGSWKDVTELGVNGVHPSKAGSSADKSTTFSFTGLDDGVYRLTETYTPEGYNTIDPITFTISASHDVEADDPALTKLEAEGLTMVADTATGTLKASIENKSGAVLPSTGGVGTTMFYIVGAILAVGAGILLVTRRRMDAQ